MCFLLASSWSIIPDDVVNTIYLAGEKGFITWLPSTCTVDAHLHNHTCYHSTQLEEKSNHCTAVYMYVTATTTTKVYQTGNKHQFELQLARKYPNQGRWKHFSIAPAQKESGGEAADCKRAQSAQKFLGPIFSSQEALGWMELCRNRLTSTLSTFLV